MGVLLSCEKLKISSSAAGLSVMTIRECHVDCPFPVMWLGNVWEPSPPPAVQVKVICLCFVIRYHCSFILFIVRLFFCFVVRLHSSPVLCFISHHCLEEKSAILILNFVQVFRSPSSTRYCSTSSYESINIIQQTPPTLS